MRRHLSVILLFSLLTSGSLELQLLAQVELQEEAEPTSNKAEEQPEEIAIPASVDAALRGVMILRVSERYLEELFARDINKQTAVSRVVMGTRARGTAHTRGRADVDTKPDVDDAAFYVRINGTTHSRTVGHNGPAIIHSRSVTTWTCQKIVRFNGEEFVTTPATIKSNTQITPLGADSSLPGLRGRIVSKIATRRACECNSAAERISGRDTDRQVLADVDRVIEQQIAKLNERVESRPLMAFLLPKLDDVGVQFSTSSNCINISFAGGEGSPLAKICPVEDSEPSDTELWFQSALIAPPTGGVSEAIDDAGAWLAEQLPDIEIPGLDLTGKRGVLPMNVQMVDGWVVFRSHDRQEPQAEASREGESTN